MCLLLRRHYRVLKFWMEISGMWIPPLDFVLLFSQNLHCTNFIKKKHTHIYSIWFDIKSKIFIWADTLKEHLYCSYSELSLHDDFGIKVLKFYGQPHFHKLLDFYLQLRKLFWEKGFMMTLKSIIRLLVIFWSLSETESVEKNQVWSYLWEMNSFKICTNLKRTFQTQTKILNWLKHDVKS